MENDSLLFLKYFQRTYALVWLLKKKPLFTMSPLEYIKISKKFVTFKFGWLKSELINKLFITFSLEGKGGVGCFDYAISCLTFK